MPDGLIRRLTTRVKGNKTEKDAGRQHRAASQLRRL